MATRVPQPGARLTCVTISRLQGGPGQPPLPDTQGLCPSPSLSVREGGPRSQPAFYPLRAVQAFKQRVFLGCNSCVINRTQ